MRELKFRAWTGKEIVYDVTPWQWDFAIITTSWRCIESSNKHCQSRHDVPAVRFKVLQQYTGLKDKNGVEIYEGDIVKGIKKGNWGEVQGVVAWVENRAGFYLDGIYSCKMGQAFLPSINYIEVIGNMYENPNLININKINMKLNKRDIDKLDLTEDLIIQALTTVTERDLLPELSGYDEELVDLEEDELEYI